MTSPPLSAGRIESLGATERAKAASPVLADFQESARQHGYDPLLVEAMVIISFEATDVFLFYIFFEAMLIPMYFLIGGFGDRAHSGSDENAATQRSYAAVPARGGGASRPRSDVTGRMRPDGRSTPTVLVRR